MEDLCYQSIVLIYPDGIVEKIPITDEQFHWNILKEHIKHSKKFASFCGNLINCGSHYPLIDKTLVQNGVCVIYNWNIREIINDPLFLKHHSAHFFYFLPSSFHSLKQLLEFIKLSQPISLKYVWIKYFSKQSPNLLFQNLNEEKFGEYILENKRKLLEKTAILLLYPDGEIEEIKRNELKTHMEHFKEHFKNSQRFRENSKDCITEYDDHEHYKVMKDLTLEGIVEVANKASDLTSFALQERKYPDEFDFDVFLPSQMGSLKQTIMLELLLKNLPIQNFNLISPHTNALNFFKPKEFEKFINESKLLFSNESLMKQAILLIYPDGEI